ncbi:DUF4148 domain-containing protein [Paraburkholderia terrae]|uniref:DUF4148 domain-containing protein n=1 Tax=Paraburkholderia terrae TaxID=311230 RepID=UPI0020483618|nr:DUF4148 domain-containing protein [Paraburkholderia terrae]BDC44663.1 hypothetical protein PTKU15_79600 [Paraburkholderia terrae]
MKALTLTVVLASLSVPSAAYAQTANDPLTRAQIHAELVQLEHAGYKPSKARYPDDIQAAEKRLASQQNDQAHVKTAIGGISSSGSQSGFHPSHSYWNRMYGHH